jgi:hypothetical protein
MSDRAAIRTEAELDDRLSAPTPGVVAALADQPGDILFLGVAGKMGPRPWLAWPGERPMPLAGSVG